MISMKRTTLTTAPLGKLWCRLVTRSLRDWRVSAYSLLFFSLFLVLVSNLVHGDELTGLPNDDPKDLQPAPASSSQPTGSSLFLPLPAWAHNSMPPLPDKLKPMGKVVVNVTPPIPAPVSLTPPKDTTPAPPVPKETAKVQTPPPAAPPSPALITVSPFLQWIKANPQAAATEARQQANSYHAPANPEAGAPSANTPTGPMEDPYWLPPLLDSANFGSQTVGGSAAIYSTPQR